MGGGVLLHSYATIFSKFKAKHLSPLRFLIYLIGLVGLLCLLASLCLLDLLFTPLRACFACLLYLILLGLTWLGWRSSRFGRNLSKRAPNPAKFEVADFLKTHVPTVISKLVCQPSKNSPTPAKTLELPRF